MTSHTYTIHKAYDPGADLHVVLAVGRSTDPVLVGLADSLLDAMQGLGNSPHQGRDPIPALEWALRQCIHRPLPSSRDALELYDQLVEDTAQDMWLGAEKWTPYALSIQDDAAYLSWSDPDGSHDIAHCDDKVGHVRDMLEDLADTYGGIDGCRCARLLLSDVWASYFRESA